MNAAEAKKQAERALQYMREHAGDAHRCFGWAWGTFARIAGQDDLPLPDIKAALMKEKP